MAQKITTRLSAFLQDQTGATSIEYCMIGAAMTIAIIALMPLITTALSAKYSTLGSSFNGF